MSEEQKEKRIVECLIAGLKDERIVGEVAKIQTLNNVGLEKLIDAAGRLELLNNESD
jgi:hypothetical protein